MTEELKETELTSLMKSTLQLLQNRSAKIMLKQIAAELNEGVTDKADLITKEWLYKFHQDALDEPKHAKVIKKIVKLHKYLVSKLNLTLT